MAMTLVTGPAVEPLGLAETKLHLRVTTPDEDGLIDTLIRAARLHVEKLTRRALITQTWDWTLDAFPGCEAMRLPLANATTVSSITYTAQDGTSTVWSSALYQTDLPVGPTASFARVAPAYQEVYPVTRDVMNAVTVRFVAGYGATAATVPEGIKAAMKLMIGHWFHNRETVVVGIGIGAVAVPETADLLLWPFRAW